MNRFREMGLLLAIIALSATLGFAEGITKYDGTFGAAADTAAAVLFGAQPSRQKVVAVEATSDLAGAVVKYYIRTDDWGGKAAPLSSATNGQSVIHIANASANWTNSDTVVYMHANGFAEYRTLSSVAATNVTLSAALTAAGASGDYLYEIEQQGLALVGDQNSAGPGTNDPYSASGTLFVVPGDSPLYVTLDGTSNTVLTVTVD